MSTSRHTVLPFSSKQAFSELLLISRLVRSSGWVHTGSQPVARLPPCVRLASELPALCRKAACLLRFTPATPLKQGPSAACFLSAAPRGACYGALCRHHPVLLQMLCYPDHGNRCGFPPALPSHSRWLLGRPWPIIAVCQMWEHRDLSAKCVECLGGVSLHVGWLVWGFFCDGLNLQKSGVNTAYRQGQRFYGVGT